MEKEENKTKSLGEMLDELLNNPEVMMKQCSEVIKKTKEEAEKIINKNKELEEEIFE